MFYFGDDSSCSSCGNVRQQDVFLFGGYYTARDVLKKLERRIGEIKAKYGSNERLPLKWNFRDLYPIYAAAGQDTLYKNLLAESDTIRLEFLQLLKEFNATVLIAAIRGHSLNDLKTRRAYHSWALTMILQRLGFDCGREDATDTMKIQVILDWPGADIQKAHFEVGHKAYHDGEGCDGQKYKAGRLRAKGFFPSLTYSSTEHNPFLQLADMTVGACNGFCKWSFSGKPVPPRLKEMFPTVFQQIRQVYNYDRFTTGFAIAPVAFSITCANSTPSFGNRLRRIRSSRRRQPRFKTLPLKIILKHNLTLTSALILIPNGRTQRIVDRRRRRRPC